MKIFYLPSTQFNFTIPKQLASFALRHKIISVTCIIFASYLLYTKILHIISVKKETISSSRIVNHFLQQHSSQYQKNTQQAVTLSNQFPNQAIKFEDPLKKIDPMSQLKGKKRIVFTNGEIWEGDFREGKLHGEGCKTFANGSVWRGTFVEGDLHGNGEKIDSEYIKLQGNFEHNQLVGKARIIFPNNEVWEGLFKDKKLEGFGKKILSDGTIWQGFFVAGQLQGEVTITNKEKTWKGKLKDQQLEGPGELKLSNGKIFEGKFQNGHFENIRRKFF